MSVLRGSAQRRRLRSERDVERAADGGGRREGRAATRADAEGKGGREEREHFCDE